MKTAGHPLLAVRDLRVAYETRAGTLPVVRGIDLTLGAGEALGIVGESGCGKSTLAMSIVRYLGDTGRIAGGTITFEGRDILALSDVALRTVRGQRIGVVYQDPLSCLNPMIPIGKQLMEVPMLHDGASEFEARRRAVRMVEEVNLPDAERLLERYPHQLSGGQQQRILIAMALIAEPALLILDEPTTGLDVTVEAAVLKLVGDLRRRRGTAILHISHNLGAIVQVCDRIAVLYAGEIVEEGQVRTVLERPRHPYTRGLLHCLPGRHRRGARLFQIPGQLPALGELGPGCGFADRCYAVDAARCRQGPIALRTIDDGTPAVPTHGVRCARAEEIGDDLPPDVPAVPAAAAAGEAAGAAIAIRGLHKVYEISQGLFGRARHALRALNGVSMDAAPGTTLAIVGESGCGKSTLARILSGLTVASAGSVRIDGAEMATVSIERRSTAGKRAVQMVFQNPDSTLNPSHSAGFAIRRSLRRLRGLSYAEADAETGRLLAQVRLGPEIDRRMPMHLSGGQKQRVAIARALAARPRAIVADEPVSALDMSVQATILNLLGDLQAATGTTYVFVSHDLAVVRQIADHIAVMYMGQVVEFGPAARIFRGPCHPYTEALLAATVQLDGATDGKGPAGLDGAPPSPLAHQPGCPFVTRCPRRLGPACLTPPPEQHVGDGHRIACHIEASELARLQAARLVPAQAESASRLPKM